MKDKHKKLSKKKYVYLIKLLELYLYCLDITQANKIYFLI